MANVLTSISRTTMSDTKSPPSALTELIRSHRRVSLTLLVTLFVAYFGFIYLISSAPALMAYKIVGIPLGIHLGLGLILLSCVLTGIYITWANRSYDTRAEQLRREWNKKGSRK